MGNYIQDWEGHESDFHNVTQYGSKMCHATVVDGEVASPVLLVLNLTQLKSHGIRLW